MFLGYYRRCNTLSQRCGVLSLLWYRMEPETMHGLFTRSFMVCFLEREEKEMPEMLVRVHTHTHTQGNLIDRKSISIKMLLLMINKKDR
mgnify:CR=1 FL=1